MKELDATELKKAYLLMGKAIALEEINPGDLVTILMDRVTGKTILTKREILGMEEEK